MTALLIALFVFVVAGLAASAWLRARPASESRLAGGLQHLAALRWREFTHLVLQAMQLRGYRVLKDENSPGDDLPSDGGDILLERNGQRVLLLCKYGNASVVGAPPILGLGKSAELRGAHAAIVVTPGRFDSEARRVAAAQHVELIDGATLWPEVEPFLEHGTLSAAGAGGSPGVKSLIAWTGASMLAAITWFAMQGVLIDPSPPVATPAVGAPAASPTNPASSAPVRVAVAPPAQGDAVPTDPAILIRRRNETANAISTLAGVDRAVWATPSTLVVYLASEDSDPSTRLCPLLERYPELAASRVQLQPPQDSLRSVRFRQCKAY